MRVVVVLSVLLLVPALIYCQSDVPQANKGDYTDAIVLKNGGKIVGKIIDREENKSVTIERADGLVLKVPFKKIHIITTADRSEQEQSRVMDSLEFTDYLDTESRGRTSARMGVLMVDDFKFFATSIVFGSSVTEALFIAVGVEYDYSADTRFLPVFAEFRSYELFGSLPIYFLSQLGYAPGWITDYTGSDYGGMMIALGLGADVSIGEGLALSGIINYRRQNGLEKPHIFAVMAGFVF